MIRVAPAKLNLTLDVLGRRADGYHEIRSAMVPISLGDHLEATLADDLTAWNPGILPAADLVLAAARALKDASGTRLGAHITVKKEIPPGAGLGGGSSDAATTLLLLDDLWDLGAAPKDLLEIAGRLGSDVPFFLGAGPAIVEGRGEITAGAFAAPDVTFVVVKPPESLATAAVYAACRPGGGRRTERFLASLGKGPPDFAGNDLEEPARRLLPALDRLFKDIRPHVGHLTGSGSALFVPFADAGDAEAFQASLTRPDLWSRTARALKEMPSGRANANARRRSTLAC